MRYLGMYIYLFIKRDSLINYILYFINFFMDLIFAKLHKFCFKNQILLEQSSNFPLNVVHSPFYPCYIIYVLPFYVMYIIYFFNLDIFVNFTSPL